MSMGTCKTRERYRESLWKGETVLHRLCCPGWRAATGSICRARSSRRRCTRSRTASRSSTTRAWSTTAGRASQGRASLTTTPWSSTAERASTGTGSATSRGAGPHTQGCFDVTSHLGRSHKSQITHACREKRVHRTRPSKRDERVPRVVVGTPLEDQLRRHSSFWGDTPLRVVWGGNSQESLLRREIYRESLSSVLQPFCTARAAQARRAALPRVATVYLFAGARATPWMFKMCLAPSSDRARVRRPVSRGRRRDLEERPRPSGLADPCSTAPVDEE